jgi:hypothetical protein
MATNLKTIAAPWNPDTPIEAIFTNGNHCRQFAIEGGDPITDAAYMRILTEIFSASGVLTKAVDDWEDLEEEDQTVAALMAHFTKADNNRINKAATLKGVLSGNSAKANGAQHPPQGFDYCWSHGLCDHTSATCTTKAKGHNKTATLTNLCGGCTWIQRPPGYKPIFKLPPRTGGNSNRDRPGTAAAPPTTAPAREAQA